MPTTHEMMRSAVIQHGLLRDEVAIHMAVTEPRITSKFAGQLYDALMDGKPCKEILAMAIIRMVGKKLGISDEAAIDVVLPPPKQER